MQAFVALLYSTVISPARRLKSADLMAIGERLKLADTRPVLSSGNFIFRSALLEAKLAETIGAEVSALYGRAVPVLVRSEIDWRALLAHNPWPTESTRTPAHVGVRIMAKPPGADVVARISDKAKAGEKLIVRDRAIWVYTPAAPTNSTLFRAVNAAWVGIGTSRNASAVMKISQAFDVHCAKQR